MNARTNSTAFEWNSADQDALFQALSDAWDSVPCRNGDAGVAFLMFLAKIQSKNPHFLPIVLSTWSRDPANPEAAIQ